MQRHFEHGAWRPGGSWLHSGDVMGPWPAVDGVISEEDPCHAAVAPRAAPWVDGEEGAAFAIGEGDEAIAGDVDVGGDLAVAIAVAADGLVEACVDYGVAGA